MPVPALQRLEKEIGKQIRLFELKKSAIERKIDKQLRAFDAHRSAFEKKVEGQFRHFETKHGIRLDDELRFIRSWIEKPLSIGSVTPSGRVLARTMARYVDANGTAPIIELGPGTGPVTDALIQKGVDPSRLVLVEFDKEFCQLLQARYPQATVVQGDAYSLRRLLNDVIVQPAAAIVSGLPLMTKPLRTRLRLVSEGMNLLMPGAPFVQFTYAVVSPIPKRLAGVRAEASKPIWRNVPPARVWVYRKD
ncbi:MAG TPA: rRNA adenine N-6-methyltransferase family protein [Xanthobacteraceae bacterium]|nr:rRNA adenine N-6-methyltransferase family protein [Xanthobacteraceae bacterium]